MVQPVASFEVSGAGGGAPVRVPGFVVPHQAKDFWCWAALTEGVINAYRPGAGPDQDRIARVSLGSRYPADTTLLLDDVLRGYFRGPLVDILDDGTDYFETLIRPEIDAGRPLCAQITFSRREHYVGISGYYQGAGGIVLLIEDPADNDPGNAARRVPLDELRSSYDGTGSNAGKWYFAFKTKSGTWP